MSDAGDDNEVLVNAETVRSLARVAGLDLPADRVAGVAEQLNGLLVEADAVNRFMDARRDVPPAFRFHHPDAEEHGR
jgi:hypothetical protein